MSAQQFFKIIVLFLVAQSFQCIPIDFYFNRPKSTHRSLTKRALSYIANDTVCVIDNLIYQNGDPIPTDDLCESCKCRPPGFACVLRECDVKPGCKEIAVEGECCPSYQCGCEHEGKFYKDGEIVPSSKKLLNCYTCKCKGSLIVCGLMDCQLRYDCESRYKSGECCPNYDHCEQSFQSSTSEQTIRSQNQSFSDQSNLFNKLTTERTTSLISDQMNNRLELERTTTSGSVIPDVEDISSVNKFTVKMPIKLSPSSNSISIDDEQPLVTTTRVSFNQPMITSSTPKNLFDTNDDSIKDQSAVNNHVIDENQSHNDSNMSLDENSKKVSSSETSTLAIEIINETASKSTNELITQSSNVDDDANSLSSNQVDQLDRRTDDSRIDDIDKNDHKNFISDLPSQSSNDINEPSQFITTTHRNSIERDVLSSSTSVPNLMDTTILAPPHQTSNSIGNFMTPSPIAKASDSLINLKSLDKKDDDNAIAKNNSIDSVQVNNTIAADHHEELKSSVDNNEEILIRKLEEKLEQGKSPVEEKLEQDRSTVEEKSEQDRSTVEEKSEQDRSSQLINDQDDEIMKTPLELLKKVLDNCSNGRCNNIDLLIKTTEQVLEGYDSSIIERIKLTNAFEKLKKDLLVTNSTLNTDNTMINTTDSSIQLDEENYLTTISYVNTSDLVAEHKSADGDDLELDDLMKI